MDAGMIKANWEKWSVILALVATLVAWGTIPRCPDIQSVEAANAAHRDIRLEIRTDLKEIKVLIRDLDGRVWQVLRERHDAIEGSR